MDKISHQEGIDTTFLVNLINRKMDSQGTRSLQPFELIEAVDTLPTRSSTYLLSSGVAKLSKLIL